VIKQSTIWRRLDYPGFEAARLELGSDGWSFRGTAVFHIDLKPCRLDYVIQCDLKWHTESVTIDGWMGTEIVRHEIKVDPRGRWYFDGAERPDLDGCVDIDLGFSPSTNTLPIRRLNLGIGDSSPVRAAWVPVPGFELRPLEQVYRRLGVSRYRYESSGGAFVVDLQVDQEGMVIEYPGFWEPPRAERKAANAPI
jgi:hypothetical protein